MIELDYSQFSCPHPVVEARKQMLANPAATIFVLLGDQTAKENVSRLASKMGYQVDIEPDAQNFRLTLTPATEQKRQQQPEEVAIKSTGDTVVFCGSDQMGQGDVEFGQILLKNFLATLLELDPLPDCILLVNSGVKLVCTGSDALETLNQLACRGVDIASCGLCLEYYHLKDRLKVGRVTNMLEIAEAQMQAGQLIKP